jgi:hypothetical protein
MFEDFPLNESAWRRGWDDALRFVESPAVKLVGVLLDGAFAAGGAILIFATKSPSGAEVVLAAILGAVGGAVVLGGGTLLVQLVRAPLRQRNDARTLLVGLSQSSFADADWDLRHMFRIPSEDDPQTLVLPIRFTNRHPRRRMSLDLTVHLYKLVEGARASSYQLFPLGGEYTDALIPPLELKPESTAKGALYLGSYFEKAFYFAESLAVYFRDDGHELLLRMRDHVTGSNEDIVLPIPVLNVAAELSSRLRRAEAHLAEAQRTSDDPTAAFAAGTVALKWGTAFGAFLDDVVPAQAARFNRSPPLLHPMLDTTASVVGYLQERLAEGKDILKRLSE